MIILNDSKHAKCNDNMFQEECRTGKEQEQNDVFDNKSHIRVVFLLQCTI